MVAIAKAMSVPDGLGPGTATHLLTDTPALDPDIVRVAVLVTAGFVAEIGWDPDIRVLSPPSEHPLLGRPTCRAAGCATTATTTDRVCASCRRRLVGEGLDVGQVGQLAARPWPSQGPWPCAVAGCRRVWESARTGLCRTHEDRQHAMGVDAEAFLVSAQARPLGPLPLCAVAACPRQRRHCDGHYCEAHQQRRRQASRRDGDIFDEAAWQATEPPVGRGGQVSLRGLPPRVVVQLLFGLQQRCRLDGVKTKEADLRVWCNQLRAQRIPDLDAYELPAGVEGTFQAMVHGIVGHAGRALASPESEAVKDIWELVVFGHHGTVDFTGLSQPWLREAAKRWAADDLPRRKIRAGRRTSGGLTVRHHIGCLERLSEVLRLRVDHGEVPAALSRTDIEVFLNRLAFLEASGQISTDARVRACREVRSVLSRARAMGLTRPGALAGGLGEDFAIHTADIPIDADPAEAGRDLPGEIMRQICTHLELLTSPSMRTGIVLAIDTGRRPEEICSLPLDCLARDNDGLAVLIYDNHKAGRLGRRLPITEHTAEVIVTQQQRVRDRYPDTSTGRLKLLPTDRRNPEGSRAITGFSLAFHHRRWIDQMPLLVTTDGLEFDKARVVLYAYRHTYAQRHADAGVPVDVLAELMDHRKLDTTSGYYHIGEGRRHEAVDRVAAMQFDRHGNRIWRSAQQLLDSERARRAVGQVAVPFGMCAEPSNVTAGGGACPFRFRCVGCDHFRTDISYLPDLHAYLDDLLATRERLAATSELDGWARADAMPSNEEIAKVRRLIDRVRGGLDQLTDHDRAQIDHAVTVVRQHRTATAGSLPRIRQPLPVFRPEPTDAR